MEMVFSRFSRMRTYRYEMVQFNPTGMVTPEDKVGTLVTEAVRGGGILLNKDGERFMINYDKKEWNYRQEIKLQVLFIAKY